MASVSQKNRGGQEGIAWLVGPCHHSTHVYLQQPDELLNQILLIY